MKSGSNLEKLFNQGEFCVTAEVGPPRSASSKGVIRHARELSPYVDGLNVTDNQTAIVRLSSVAGCVHILNCGGEPVLQVTCRDRNRIAIQSDILGAASLGVKNVLCLSGDHQSFGSHPGAKNVYDIDSIQLLAMLKGMRDDKKFQNGDDIKFEPRLFLGAAENPFADPYEFRVLRLAKKITAGADFIQTQAVFDVPRFRQWMEQVCEQGLDKKTGIMAGVIPVKSPKAIKYMSGVPGMRIPSELVERMEQTSSPEDEGVALCSDIIEQVREIPGVRGVHIMAVYWESIVPTIVERVGLYPRPAIKE